MECLLGSVLGAVAVRAFCWWMWVGKKGTVSLSTSRRGFAVSGAVTCVMLHQVAL